MRELMLRPTITQAPLANALGDGTQRIFGEFEMDLLQRLHDVLTVIRFGVGGACYLGWSLGEVGFGFELEFGFGFGFEPGDSQLLFASLWCFFANCLIVDP